MNLEAQLESYTDTNINLIAEKGTPVVLAFHNDANFDVCKSRKVVHSLSMYGNIASRFSFGQVSALKNPKAVGLFGLSIIPAVVISYRGKAVSIFSGEEISIQFALDSCKRLLSALDSPDNIQENLNKLEEHSRQKASMAGKRLSAGRWEMVPLSGIITGVIMAVSRVYLGGITWLLPTGFAYAFFIMYGNFRFNATQKFVATGLMLGIGIYWQEFLNILRAIYQ